MYLAHCRSRCGDGIEEPAACDRVEKKRGRRSMKEMSTLSRPQRSASAFLFVGSDLLEHEDTGGQREVTSVKRGWSTSSTALQGHSLQLSNRCDAAPLPCQLFVVEQQPVVAAGRRCRSVSAPLSLRISTAVDECFVDKHAHPTRTALQSQIVLVFDDCGECFLRLFVPDRPAF